MSVYDALGASHVDDEVKVVLHSLFVFRFFFFGQDATTPHGARDSMRRRIALARD
jgi:hypothetical protein